MQPIYPLINCPIQWPSSFDARWEVIGYIQTPKIYHFDFRNFHNLSTMVSNTNRGSWLKLCCEKWCILNSWNPHKAHLHTQYYWDQQNLVGGKHSLSATILCSLHWGLPANHGLCHCQRGCLYSRAFKVTSNFCDETSSNTTQNHQLYDLRVTSVYWSKKLFTYGMVGKDK